ncbi:tetratricopeptide repeat protein [Hymenobacter sp. GOD-10R]|uniref:type IX secretion system periplasmic lipoprotein PorW/SprE n=1 Tax=Hymenobacter sp. GOD-10R TaxID=3093922 RepID=UPI002D7783B2|nr:tetratricopeptide repeat protein [Hymenobacter sp. GOD-10R]WRQ27919.1 tetratricopeptide repeat protein [Hymenobacter sp. GOD-10R]
MLPIVVAGLDACSSERSVVGKTYDNVVARDNAYFLAREKMRTLEASLYKNRVNDYNQILPLFPTLDEATTTKITADLDDIIKKASLPIQHRPGSDWTDDSYVLIGKARYYKMELEDAIKTFKYTNTTSKDPNAKHEALIWLMRSFLADKDYESALLVSNLLDKEQGKEQNARELFLTRAQYYLLTGDQKLAIEQLEKAIPYIEEKNEQSRTRYILAQLYQANNDDKKAYAELNKILKRNPPYELDFFSKLMLGQVSDLNLTDRARLDKYFTKLLKDTKNKEYRDKIYYEMARLNYRQQRYDQALALLQKSARTPGPNKAQKSYTYLLAGRIYYENLQKYRLAAAYYDSTVQNMPKTAPGYEATAERSAILKDFAQQITIVETQDSLQALAKLDPATLQTRLTAYAVTELENQKKEQERLLAQQEKQARQQESISGVSSLRAGDPNIDPNTFAATSTGAQWYFDNPAALGTARSEFIRRWGDRQLQDNWRVTSQASGSAVTNRGGNVPVSIAGANNTSVNTTGQAATPAPTDPAAQQEALVAKYRQAIPLTEAQMQASQKQVEEALFILGTIYGQQLREPARAAETYEKVVARFPQSKHLPESYYSLYLIYKEQPNAPKAEAYALRLRQEFPNSSYAKLVADPEYLRRTSIVNAKVSVQVDSAFALYKRQEFKKAADLVAATRQQYPENDLNDRLAFLTTLLTIRTQPPLTAKASVEKFYKDFPDSQLSSQALTMLNTYKEYEAGKITGALASTDKPVVSIFKPGEVESRLRVIYAENQAAVASARAGKTVPIKQQVPRAVINPADAPVAPSSTPPVATTPASATTTSAATSTPATAVVPPTSVTPTPTLPTATSTSPVPAVTPSANNKEATTPAVPSKPATAFIANPNVQHVVVLAFPKGASPLKDMPTLLGTYNSRFFRANNLTIRESSLNDALDMVVIQPLPSAKIAQSYALKLRGPQSPLSRLRGVGYQTLVIGIDNLPLLLQSKDVEEYQRFYQQTYAK